MALPSTPGDLERGKFREVSTTPGAIAVAVTNPDGTVISGAGGGGAATIADGADVAEGATTDAAVTAGSTGTVSGKLRRISSDISAGNTARTDGTQQAKLTDGTNIANVLKSDGTAAGQNAQLVAGTYLSVPFTTTTAQAVGTTDAGNYKSVSVHITLQGTSSTVSFQCSNDNINWNNISLNNLASTGSSFPVSSTTAVQVYGGSLGYRYFRLNVTGISALTTAGTIVFSTMPFSPNPSAINVGSTSATGSAVPANAFYMGLLNNNAGTLVGLNSLNVADGATGNSILSAGNFLYNNSTFDKQRSVINATNSIGTGIVAVGALAQFDDVSPTAITENQFGNLRMSTNRNLYSTIRDAAGNERGANVDAANNLNVVNYASTSTLTNVASSGTNVTLLSSNTAAKSRIVYNESTQVLYLKFGVTASVTSYTVQVPANSLFEFPLPNYTGQVDGLWASANGNARVTEVT